MPSSQPSTLSVSVIVPAYNAASVLGRAIDSVLRQSEPVSEIILVDDGSSDDTGRIVRAYGSAVRYFYQDNAGVSAARNRGIRESTGQWIAFLDSDDEWLPHKIERQTALLKAHPHLKWCGCNVEFVDKGTATSAPIAPEWEKRLARAGSLPFFEALSRGGVKFIGTSGAVIHAAVLAELGCFDTSLKIGEDRDLFWRVAMKYPEIGYCQEVSFRYYVDSPNSLTKAGHPRTGTLRNICDNMRRARAVGREVENLFYPYARRLALDLLLRAAVREVEIAPEAIQEAKSLFVRTLRERMLLTTLNCLPAPFARKLLNRTSR